MEMIIREMAPPGYPRVGLVSLLGAPVANRSDETEVWVLALSRSFFRTIPFSVDFLYERP